MTSLPLLPPSTVDAATLGSWCPKLCTFACPVHEATGRTDAMPWHFHRVVTALAAHVHDPADLAHDLVACSGCLACRSACTFDQDVPAQVRDARAIARPSTPAADSALANIEAGRRPDGTVLEPPAANGGGTTVLHVGCHDPVEVVEAAVRLLRAAGHEVAVLADGCCGQLATDLGAPDIATGRHDATAAALADAARVVTLDPHCTPALRTASPDLEAVDLWSVLAADPPSFTPGDRTTVTWHDPCLLARDAGVVTPPRQLLAAAGYEVVEPEHHGPLTACAGSGMGLPLLDADAAAATGARRTAHLAAAADRAITACSRAGTHLRSAGSTVDDLAVALAARLTDPA